MTQGSKNLIAFKILLLPERNVVVEYTQVGIYNHICRQNINIIINILMQNDMQNTVVLKMAKKIANDFIQLT